MNNKRSSRAERQKYKKIRGIQYLVSSSVSPSGSVPPQDTVGPTVSYSVLTVSTSVQQCSALSIRYPAVPSCVQVSVSVQHCPDRVHGVQHCPAVFSSIQQRPAVFRCLVVPSCVQTVSVSVQLRPNSPKCSTLFNIVQQCPPASSSVQQCIRTFAMRILVALEFYILLLSSQPSCFFLALLLLNLLLCKATSVSSSSQYHVTVLFYKCSCQACYRAMGRLFSVPASAYYYYTYSSSYMFWFPVFQCIFWLSICACPVASQRCSPDPKPRYHCMFASYEVATSYPSLTAIKRYDFDESSHVPLMGHEKDKKTIHRRLPDEFL